MKNAISNIWLLGLVASFIFLFSGYLAVTISYSSAFKMKNELLSIIEKHRGITSNTGESLKSQIPGVSETVKGNLGALQTMNIYLNGSGYKVKGACPVSKKNEKWYGVKSLEFTKTTGIYEEARKGTKYYYCFSKYDAYGDNNSYYKIKMFFKMDVPVLGDLFTFNIDGTTDDIFNDKGII